jgi:HEAT repeat protein
VSAPTDESRAVARRFAALVARAAAEPNAAALRGEVRAFAKPTRGTPVVFAPGDADALLVDGEPLVAGESDADSTAHAALLAGRLRAYGVEEISITPKAIDADLFDLIRLLAAAPAGAEAAAQFASRAAVIDARTIPRRLAVRAEVVEAPSAPVPTVASAPPKRASKQTPAVAPEVAPPSAPPEDTRNDRLLEALEVPKSKDPALKKLIKRLQGAEKLEELTEPLDELATYADLAFRTGRHEHLVESLAALVAIEHQQLERDGSDERRRAFARTLRALAKPLILRQLAVMRHKFVADAVTARRTQAILHRYGSDGAEALIDEYVTASTPEARAVMLDALRSLRRTHDALFALVRDTRDLVVRQAAAILGELGDERGEQLLVELLRHPDARARRAAVSALAKFTTPSALEAMSLALDDESSLVRGRAVAVLATRSGARPVQLLAPLLDVEPDREVLYAAVAALGAIGGPEAVAALIRCAQGETEHPRKKSASYRIQACMALVAIRTPQAMAGVQALREDRDREVKDAAVRLVAQASRRTVATRAIAG